MLNTFFNNKSLSDIKIKFGNQEVFAHRLVLVQNSVWLEKALLGNFKVSCRPESISIDADWVEESKQNVIDLGKDDDPAAVIAMLRYFYDDKYYYIPPARLDSSLHQHMIMYRLADKYDVAKLRKEAAKGFLESLRACFVGTEEELEKVELSRAVRMTQKILGPDAGAFADKSIQEDVFAVIIQQTTILYKHELFQKPLVTGKMFDEVFGQGFTQKTGELLAASSALKRKVRQVLGF